MKILTTITGTIPLFRQQLLRDTSKKEENKLGNNYLLETFINIY